MILYGLLANLAVVAGIGYFLLLSQFSELHRVFLIWDILHLTEPILSVRADLLAADCCHAEARYHTVAR